MLIPLLDAIVEHVAGPACWKLSWACPTAAKTCSTNILNKLYGMLFNEFEGNHTPEAVGGDGDVKYHLGFSANHFTADKRKVHLTLTANPSHLEAVDPVVEGRMRAKQRRFHDRDRRLGVPILIHGDAAFAGQGLVAETLNLSQLPGYRTGGTVHIVVNNQIVFDHLAQRWAFDALLHRCRQDDRSTLSSTSMARTRKRWVFVGELALDFRQRFGRGVCDRHASLPPARAQRAGRARVHAASNVREDQ